VGKAVLDAEGCKTFVLPEGRITQGWEILERAAEEEGLV
jgi:hypothetical protein